MSLNYNGKNIVLAKNLRKNSTRQEKHLWYDFLAKYKARFQRQKAIDNFIADFYCHSAKLIIEIDGYQHFYEETKEYDQKRTEYLEGLGFYILRFENTEVNKDIEEVRYIINNVCESLANGVKLAPEYRE